MELCKYNEYRLYAYKNIKLPDASSRKYRKICLMACIYACIFRIKIYTMYLWDTFGKCIWRGSIVTHERIKKRIYYYYNTSSLPPPLPPVAAAVSENFCDTLAKRHDRLRALGQKTLERFHYSRGEAKVKQRRWKPTRNLEAFLSLRKRVRVM